MRSDQFGMDDDRFECERISLPASLHLLDVETLKTQSYADQLNVGRRTAQRLASRFREDTHLIDDDDFERIGRSLSVFRAQLNIIQYHLPCLNPDEYTSPPMSAVPAFETHCEALDLIEYLLCLLRTRVTRDDAISTDKKCRLVDHISTCEEQMTTIRMAIPWLRNTRDCKTSWPR